MEFIKTSAISSICIKTFGFFFCERSDKSSSFSFDHYFFARMRCLKNGYPRSALPRAYFYHPQLPKLFWWKLTSSSFHQTKLKEYKPYPCQGEQVIHVSGLRGLMLCNRLSWLLCCYSKLPHLITTFILVAKLQYFSSVKTLSLDSMT